MSLIEIEGHIGDRQTLESLSLAVSTLSRAGVQCHGVPISPGALYALIEVQDRQTNYAVCVLKSSGFAVSPDSYPVAAVMPAPGIRPR